VFLISGFKVSACLPYVLFRASSAFQLVYTIFVVYVVGIVFFYIGGDSVWWFLFYMLFLCLCFQKSSNCSGLFSYICECCQCLLLCCIMASLTALCCILG
jgi:hypothetical protein